MCTVSFAPTARGFRLAMNRDEKKIRIRGLAPSILRTRHRCAILPREPNGGTWIALNDAGICLALVNWHAIERAPRGKIASRGLVIDALATVATLGNAAERLKQLPLPQLRPFRLLVVVARTRDLIEWRWDLRRLRRRKHAWQIGHWFSSGFDEAGAERERAEICAHAKSLNSPSGLRKLHRSHLPQRGPLSICMHRGDAATVSYTEVAVSARRVTMRYADGPPCRHDSLLVTTLPRW